LSELEIEDRVINSTETVNTVEKFYFILLVLFLFVRSNQSIKNEQDASDMITSLHESNPAAEV
jgi:hypothetical protein